jgi:hypothetical protein
VAAVLARRHVAHAATACGVLYHRVHFYEHCHTLMTNSSDRETVLVLVELIVLLARSSGDCIPV